MTMPLPNADWQRMHRLAVEFERQLLAGETPSIDATLAEAGELRAVLLPELLHADLEFRRRRGEVVAAADYRTWYPELSDEDLAELNAAVERCRRDTPTGPLDTVPGAAVGPTPTIPGYILFDHLGQGGMGVVYRARDERLQRNVALKLLRPECAADQIDRFRREAEAAARLQHNGVVQIFEIGEVNRQIYLAQELVPGGSLHQALADGPLPPDRAGDLIARLARAVQAAHEAGVIHRDIKPANILLTSEGQPKLGDFGLARLVDSVGRTHTGTIMGTPGYMAPEQAAGATVGPAADVYSLGAVLYECLTGRPPFRGATAMDTLDQLRHRDPVPVRQLQPSAPPDLETICLKCLAKEPTRRYASASALADDLDRFRTGRPILARPVSAWERTGKWMRRHPAGAGLIATALLSALAISLTTWRHTRQLSEALSQETQARQEADADRLRTLSALEAITSTGGEEFISSRERLSPQQKKFFENAAKIYAELAERRADDPAAKTRLARAQFQLGMVASRLERHADAIAALEQADRLFAELVDDPDEGELALQGRARANRSLALVARDQRRRVDEEALLRRSLHYYDQLLARAPRGAAYQFERGHVLNSLGVLAGVTGRQKDARQFLESARSAYESLAPLAPREQHYLANTLTNLGVEYIEERNPAAAIEVLEKALGLRDNVMTAEPGPEAATMLARTLGNLAEILMDLGPPDRARAILLRCLTVREKLAGELPGVPDHRRELIRCLTAMVRFTQKHGPESDPLRHAEQAATHATKLLADHPAGEDSLRHAAIAFDDYARLVRFTDVAKAVDFYDRSADARRRLLEKHPNDHGTRLWYALSFVSTGHLLLARQPADALQRLDKALPHFDRYLQSNANDTATRNTWISARVYRAQALAALQRTAEAMAAIEAVLQHDAAPKPNQERYLDVLAVLVNAGATERAVTMLKTGIEAGLLKSPNRRLLFEQRPDLAGLRGHPDIIPLLRK